MSIETTQLRLATMEDLVAIKSMYGCIIRDMNLRNIQIWDEIYPCEFFNSDIENKQLYVLEKDLEIISAFVLSDSNSGSNYVEWAEPLAKACTLDRFAVSVQYVNQGIGSLMLSHAMTLSKARNAEYLRLFVVDFNEPAKKLYEKNGFQKVKGIYQEIIDDELTLNELGYEIKLEGIND